MSRYSTLSKCLDAVRFLNASIRYAVLSSFRAEFAAESRVADKFIHADSCMALYAHTQSDHVRRTFFYYFRVFHLLSRDPTRRLFSKSMCTQVVSFPQGIAAMHAGTVLYMYRCTKPM